MSKEGQINQEYRNLTAELQKFQHASAMSENIIENKVTCTYEELIQ